MSSENGESPIVHSPEFVFGDSHTLADLNEWIEDRQRLEAVWYMRTPEEKAQPCSFDQALEPQFWNADPDMVRATYESISADDLQLVHPSNISTTLWRRPFPRLEPDDYRIGRIAFPAAEFSRIPFSVKKIEERVSIAAVTANRRDNPLFDEYSPGADNAKVARSVVHALERPKAKMQALLLSWEAENDWLVPLAYLSRSYNRNREIPADEMQEKLGITIDNRLVSYGDMEYWMKGLLSVSSANMLDAMRMQLQWTNETHRQAALAFGKRMFDDPKKASFVETAISITQTWNGKKRERVYRRLADIERIIGSPGPDPAS